MCIVHVHVFPDMYTIVHVQCIWMDTCVFYFSGDEFTLEKIIEIGLDQFSEVIGEISSAASKELAIEQAIADIANQWQDFRLDVGPYKERGHFRLKWDTYIYMC